MFINDFLIFGIRDQDERWYPFELVFLHFGRVIFEIGSFFSTIVGEPRHGLVIVLELLRVLISRNETDIDHIPFEMLHTLRLDICNG